MGYNLTIDQGNSAAKVAVWDGTDIIFDASFKQFNNEELSDLINRFPSINQAIYCSVAQDGSEIIEFLNSRNIKTIFLDHNTLLPISNNYQSPHTLGRDRIAAAVGAWSLHKGKDILVIDMGTAITYDVVTASGCYVGGNIAPGVSMRLEALHNYTQRLPLVAPQGETPMWGYDTTTAIRSGVLNGVVGEICHYRQQLSSDHVVMLTGGSAMIVENMLDFNVEIDNYLVLKGLNSILIYNENN